MIALQHSNKNKDPGRDMWPHLEAGEAQPCSFTLCFHTPAH